MSGLKEDIEEMRYTLRDVISKELHEIQEKHGVGIRRIEPVLLDNQAIGGNKEYILGEINVEVDV